MYVEFSTCFFAETFQPTNAALTFQISLNDCARAIRGTFTFAVDLESFQLIRTKYTRIRCRCLAIVF